MPNKENKLWAALSTCSIFAFANLVVFICLGKHLGFKAFFVAVFLDVIVLPSFMKFLELMGYRKKVWDYWRLRIKLYIHKGIVLFCFFWIAFLSLICMPKILKEIYADKD